MLWTFAPGQQPCPGSPVSGTLLGYKSWRLLSGHACALAPFVCPKRRVECNQAVQLLNVKGCGFARKLDSTGGDVVKLDG
jgi:hypothetical protein